MDFVYVIMISAIAGANRGTVIEAARKAAKDGGGLEAASEAARKAASEAETTTTIQVVARMARIAGISVDGPAKRARAAADAAAKAEKARAVDSGMDEDEARASASAKAAEAYAAALPAKMREALGGRRIPAPTVVNINGGKTDGVGLPAISGAVLGAFAHNGVKLVPSFAAAAANIVVTGGFVLPEILPAKKPDGCSRFDAVADVEWANQPGHVVSGVLTGYAPAEGYRIELHVPDLIGDVRAGIDGLADMLNAGKVVVPKATIFHGAVEMVTAEDLAAKAKAAEAAKVVSIDDAIKAAFSIAPGKKPKARPKAAKPRK